MNLKYSARALLVALLEEEQEEEEDEEDLLRNLSCGRVQQHPMRRVRWEFDREEAHRELYSRAQCTSRFLAACTRHEIKLIIMAKGKTAVREDVFRPSKNIFFFGIV